MFLDQSLLQNVLRLNEASVLVRVTIAVINTMTKNNLERKGFVWLPLLCPCSSSKEVRTGTQTGQEPGDRS